MRKSGMGIYRNRPCACGSGRKAKRCCLLKYRDAEQRLRMKSYEAATEITVDKSSTLINKC